MGRGLAIWILVTGAFMAASAATASAASLSFDGQCQFSGVVQFVPPLTNSPQSVTDLADARGTCSGTLVRGARSQSLQNAAVEYVATDHGEDGTCAEEVAAGAGYLQFGRGRSPADRIAFELYEKRIAAVADLDIRGTDGGQAKGEAHINQNADPAAVAVACAGNGLARAPVDLNLLTTSPLSGRRPPAGPQGK